MNCCMCGKVITEFTYGVYRGYKETYTPDYLDPMEHVGCLCDQCAKKLQLKVRE